MFKIKYRKHKMQHYTEQYPETEFEQPEYENGYYYEPPQSIQEYDICLFCGDVIRNGHLVIITKGGEYSLHSNCILSGLTLAFSGFGMLLKLILRRKNKE